MVSLLGALPPRSPARKSYHPLMSSFPASSPFLLHKGEGLPLPQHCQDSDQANAPLPSPLQATQTRRTEPRNHYGSH